MPGSTDRSSRPSERGLRGFGGEIVVYGPVAERRRCNPRLGRGDSAALQQRGTRGLRGRCGVESYCGGKIVHSRTFRWFRAPSSSMAHPRLRSTGACRRRIAMTSRPFFGHSLGRRQWSPTGDPWPAGLHRTFRRAALGCAGPARAAHRLAWPPRSIARCGRVRSAPKGSPSSDTPRR